MTSPAHKLRDGCLSVVIWRNTGNNGTYYTAQLQRSYRQGDDNWERTDKLNADDLLPAAELLREARRWIRVQREADAKGLRETQR